MQQYVLREYQQNAMDSLFDYLKSESGHPLVVAPTGSGKSILIAETIRRAIAIDSNVQILIVAHRKELLQQNAEKLQALCPNLDIGLYSASLKSKVIEQVTVAGIASIYRALDKLQKINLLIVDECHLIMAEAEGMYRKLIESIHEKNPKARIIGFTATPFRMKTGYLTEEGGIFTDIAYEISIRELIEAGFLSRPISKQSVVQADLSDVHIRGGEYILEEAEAAMNQESLTRNAIKEIIKHGKDRKSWLIFCAGVKHANAVNEELIAQGITSQCVVGETESLFRDNYIMDFKAGSLRAITNCDVLTTGFDSPNIDLIALLRPTKSVGLYIQMIGRGSRICEGKKDCLVLDFAGNISRHGPLDMLRIVKKRARGEIGIICPPTKSCPQCETVLPVQTRICPECNYEFVSQVKHDDVASVAPLLLEPEEWHVISTEYHFHRKSGKPACMKVFYHCIEVQVNEWVCLEHGGFATSKAKQWWVEHTGKRNFPPDTATALEFAPLYSRQPKVLTVIQDGKYFKVLKVHFYDDGESVVDYTDKMEMKLSFNVVNS